MMRAETLHFVEASNRDGPRLLITEIILQLLINGKKINKWRSEGFFFQDDFVNRASYERGSTEVNIYYYFLIDLDFPWRWTTGEFSIKALTMKAITVQRPQPEHWFWSITRVLIKKKKKV